MLSRTLSSAVAAGLVCATLWIGSAAAGELLGLLSKPHAGPAPTPNKSLNRYTAVPPGQQRFYAYNVEEYPWFAHGYAVPTYNWGYFGAHFRPITSTQHRYHSGVWQATFQPAD